MWYIEIAYPEGSQRVREAFGVPFDEVDAKLANLAANSVRWLWGSAKGHPVDVVWEGEV